MIDRITYRRQFSKEEIHAKKVDESFYAINSVSYLLALALTVLEIIYMIIALDNMERAPIVGITVIFNIFIILFLFLAAIKVKVYSKTFTIMLSVFIVYLLIRVFYVIPVLFTYEIPAQITDTVLFLAQKRSDLIWLSMISFVFGLVSVVVSFKKIAERKIYKDSGKISACQMSK